MTAGGMGAVRQGWEWDPHWGPGMKLAVGCPTRWVWGGRVVVGVGYKVRRVVGGHVHIPVARSPPGRRGLRGPSGRSRKTGCPSVRVDGPAGSRVGRTQQPQQVWKSVRPGPSRRAGQVVGGRGIPPRRCHDIGCNIVKSMTAYGHDITCQIVNDIRGPNHM
jgi:hypothetical protein